MKEKRCSRCGYFKILDFFHKKKSGTFGLANYCKTCNKLVAKLHRDSDKGKEIIKARYLYLKNSIKSISGTKTCTKCNVLKPSSEFSRASKNKFGLRSNCKSYETKPSKELKAFYDKASSARYVKEWFQYFKNRYGDGPCCQVCGKTLGWHDGNETVHFDHKYGEIASIKSLSTWYRGHAFNKHNIIIWESCDFGILCRKCNVLLPTKNRMLWLENVIKYMGAINV